MRSTTLIFCAILFLESWAQELGKVETQRPNDVILTDQVVDWDPTSEAARDTNGLTSGVSRHQPRYNQPLGPIFFPLPIQPFGDRIQLQNGTNSVPLFYPRYISPFEGYSVNGTDNADTYLQSSEDLKYPFANGIVPLPSMIYYPVADTSDAVHYPQSESRSSSRPVYRSNIVRNRNLPPPLPFYTDSTRLERTERFPFPFANLADASLFLRHDARVENPQTTLPEVPASPVTSNADETPVYPNVNIFVKPTYFDRESGSDALGTLAPVKNAPLLPQNPDQYTPRSEIEPVETRATAEPSPVKLIPRRPLPPGSFSYRIPQAGLPPQFLLQNALPLLNPDRSTPPSELERVEIPATAEPVPVRFVPRQPLPLGAFPYGFPQPGFVPQFPLPPPPAIQPPIFPPLPANENLLGSVLRGQAPPPSAQPTVSGTSSSVPPPPVNSAENTEPDAVIDTTIQSEDEIDNDAKIPYEFGYEMNDGQGTDQHRKESADGNGDVTGSYGYRDPFGIYRFVNYVADKDGFRAFIHSNEPGMANPGSADVVVKAEQPPLKAIEEGLKTLKFDVVVVPDVPSELETENGGKK